MRNNFTHPVRSAPVPEIPVFHLLGLGARALWTGWRLEYNRLVCRQPWANIGTLEWQEWVELWFSFLGSSFSLPTKHFCFWLMLIRVIHFRCFWLPDSWFPFTGSWSLLPAVTYFLQLTYWSVLSAPSFLLHLASWFLIPVYWILIFFTCCFLFLAVCFLIRTFHFKVPAISCSLLHLNVRTTNTNEHSLEAQYTKSTYCVYIICVNNVNYYYLTIFMFHLGHLEHFN